MDAEGAIGPPPTENCAGALFGEPRHVLEVLRAEPELRPSGAAAFLGHAVWSSTQLLSEIARGNWGLERARAEDLAMAALPDDRESLWGRLWDTREPVHAA